MWAAVNADGEIEAQSGGISIVTTNTDGVNLLKFPRSVQRKAIVGTVTTCGILGTPCGDAGIKASACGGGAGSDCSGFDRTHVFVATFIDGAWENAGFYIAALP